MARQCNMDVIAASPTLIAAAHGTRSPVGMATVARLVAAVRAARPALDVRESYVDVAPPFLADVLAGVTGPVVIVPVLLSGGFHVRVDIPSVMGERPDTVLTPALGPDRAVSIALADRLAEARGPRPPGQRIVLVATGSTDPLARADVAAAAADLACLVRRPVDAAVLGGTGRPMGDVLTRFPPGSVDVATYLLAEGYFADKLRADAVLDGAHTVSEPIGPHPAVVDLVLERYSSGVGSLLPGR